MTVLLQWPITPLLAKTKQHKGANQNFFTLHFSVFSFTANSRVIGCCTVLGPVRPPYFLLPSVLISCFHINLNTLDVLVLLWNRVKHRESSRLLNETAYFFFIRQSLACQAPGNTHTRAPSGSSRRGTWCF